MRLPGKADPGGDTGDERNSQGKCENSAVQDAAALEDQDVAEPPVPDQHRGQQRHDGDLEHHGGDQELLGGQKTRFHVVTIVALGRRPSAFRDYADTQAVAGGGPMTEG